jgi:hypothetical protein
VLLLGVVVLLVQGEFRRGEDTFRGYMAMTGYGLFLIPLASLAWLVQGNQAAPWIVVAAGLVIPGYAVEPLVTRWIVKHHKLSQKLKVMEFLLEREAARMQLTTWRQLCAAKANNMPFLVKGRAAANIGPIHPPCTLIQRPPAPCLRGYW